MADPALIVAMQDKRDPCLPFQSGPSRRLSRALLCAALLAGLCAGAAAQSPPVQATMEPASSVAFTECWFRGREAAVPEDAVAQFEQECRSSMVPEIERQRRTMQDAEEEMTSVYRGLLPVLESRSGEAAIRARAVLEDQRAWAKYRETHCWLDMQRASGGYALAYRFARCVEDEARKRTTYLRSLMPRSGG